MPQSSYILVVDDEVNIVGLVVDLLQDEGYTVRSAPNGIAALRAVAEQKPDLILMDMYMPQMTGMMLLEQLHGQGIVDVPVVLMTASPRAAEQFIGSGTVDYLAKPFDIDNLLECVSRYVGPPDSSSAPQSSSYPQYN